MVGLEQVRDPALAGLAVDADDGLVGAPDVLGVDRQVRNPPLVAARNARGLIALERLEALLDGVLMRTGEGGVDQLAAVGVTRVDRQLVAVLDLAADLVDVGEVDHRVDALAEQVQPERHQADVAGALAVAEQASLDPVGTRLHAEFGCGYGSSAVVVRMQREHDGAAPGERAMHPLDLVGVDVGRRHLNGGRQIQHDRALSIGLPYVHDRLAHLDGVVELGAGERLGAVLPAHISGAEMLLGVLRAPLGAAHGDVLDAVTVEPENHPALQGGGRVVEVDERGARGSR